VQTQSCVQLWPRPIAARCPMRKTGMQTGTLVAGHARGRAGPDRVSEGAPSGDHASRRKKLFRPSSWNRCAAADLPRSALPARPSWGVAAAPWSASTLGFTPCAGWAPGAGAPPPAGRAAARFFSTLWHTKSRAVAMHGPAPGRARLPAAGGFRPYTLPARGGVTLKASILCFHGVLASRACRAALTTVCCGTS